ncbi:MAG: hydroxyisourate hydrolase [Candidatus Puniceispirillum sp.]|jgi:5-hydroxyisourate hydrolase|uniref:hydroxyisourate hydrolase n=1 Tax=Candidatus Puniceispirillum sp. TaxID=2026719 RepID=UPI001EB14ACF|nr:hydroxyisourate hydrolase [Candidatus Puniceispirillum sp.]MBT6414717.1 hydroxyisourate hydrolase [Candidatus Puniceispirillum sp.]MBT6566434.1 hydroxyisourate hydrolase [Candidatus Puniceispirillum sp.]
MGRLTTHVLDTARGKPAANLEIDLIRITGGTQTVLKTVVTNADGRCDAPLLEDAALERGRYKLVFHAASYLREMGDDLPEFPFLDDIVIAFGIDRDDQHYHVPLLLSAYGYSTYRGS